MWIHLLGDVMLGFDNPNIVRKYHLAARFGRKFEQHIKFQLPLAQKKCENSQTGGRGSATWEFLHIIPFFSDQVPKKQNMQRSPSWTIGCSSAIAIAIST